MDNRPIGFFDSGLGGLTSIPYLQKALPHEKIIYFGDTGRTPYGSKAITTIQKFATQIADFLVKNDVKLIVIACNTVSATCLDLLRERYPDIPILGIIEPAAETVAETCENHNVGIIGTKVTIASKAYENIIGSINPNVNIFSTPCPAFVPLIEEGIIKNDIMDLTIRYYMDDFIKSNRIDTIVLGCTHYPLILENINRLYPELGIINPSEEVIKKIRIILQRGNMFAKDSGYDHIFYASDLSENFMNMVDRIFGNESVKVKFKNLDL